MMLSSVQSLVVAPLLLLPVALGAAGYVAVRVRRIRYGATSNGGRDFIYSLYGREVRRTPPSNRASGAGTVTNRSYRLGKGWPSALRYTSPPGDA